MFMFYSVLFPDEVQRQAAIPVPEPECFHDLQLDCVVGPVLRQTKDFGLAGFYYRSLDDIATIRYRQDILRELENTAFRESFAEFSEHINQLARHMKAIQKALSSEQGYDNNYLTRGRVLNYADRYRNTICTLHQKIRRYDFDAQGLRMFQQYLAHYCESKAFIAMCGRIDRLRSAFDSVQYCMLIHEGTIKIRNYEDEPDLAQHIVRLFDKFRHGDVKDYRCKIREDGYAPHIEAAVLAMLASQQKPAFAGLDDFFQEYISFLDETIIRFASEIQFYLAWLRTIQPLKDKGLSLCYPDFTGNGDHVFCCEGYDMALALKLVDKVVPNDFRLDAPERVLVVTGPNQGGKTTYAKAFAQIHFFASLGLSVPGSSARLLLFDHIYTHFGREENLSALNGKLQDDLVRLKPLLDGATSRSILIINEIFSSTTLSDAILLSKRMMERIVKNGSVAVCVTFLDELASFNENTVSLMSTVDDRDPTVRTFRIVRKPADGLAYALHIASKNAMTYEQLNERLRV